VDETTIKAETWKNASEKWSEQGVHLNISYSFLGVIAKYISVFFIYQVTKTLVKVGRGELKHWPVNHGAPKKQFPFFETTISRHQKFRD